MSTEAVTRQHEEKSDLALMLALPPGHWHVRKGGLEILHLPLHKFLVSAMTQKPGLMSTTHKLFGHLNYYELVGFIAWLLQQPLHPAVSETPLYTTIAGAYEYKAHGGMPGLSVHDQAVTILRAGTPALEGSLPDAQTIGYHSYYTDGRVCARQHKDTQNDNYKTFYYPPGDIFQDSWCVAHARHYKAMFDALCALWNKATTRYMYREEQGQHLIKLFRDGGSVTWEPREVETIQYVIPGE